MQKIRKILVISHDTFLTGAPVLLLHLMRLLKENGYSCNTLVRLHVDVLANAFREISFRFCYFNQPVKPVFLRLFLKPISDFRKRQRIKLMLEGVDIIFSNTITNGSVLRYIKPLFKGRIFSYIHELDMASSWYTTPADLKVTLRMTDHFFVPCESVKKFLVNRKNVPAEKVSILRYYIPAFPAMLPSHLELYRQQAGIRAGFVVGAIGTVGWRKGIDIFLSVAVHVFRRTPGADIQFVWMGGAQHEPEVGKTMSDIAKTGLGHKVILLPQSGDNGVFFKSLDVMLLCSREDPYPLVVLEAASVAVPTICFNNAGGAPEFVGSDAGTIVPYLDIEAMAEAIMQYSHNKNQLMKHGAIAHKKVELLHQDAPGIYRQFETVIEMPDNLILNAAD